MEHWGDPSEDLYILCTMPSIEIGTVGGGRNCSSCSIVGSGDVERERVESTLPRRKRQSARSNCLSGSSGRRTLRNCGAYVRTFSQELPQTLPQNVNNLATLDLTGQLIIAPFEKPGISH
ncbi:unnamed protein product, partial [Tenebrio molitor]